MVVNPKDGLAYVNDFNNGLWIIRVNPKPPAGVAAVRAAASVMRWRVGALASLALAVGSPRAQGQVSPAPVPPAHDYLVFVASEGNDQIALVRFGPKGARVERVHQIGTNRTELVGPHGIAVSPDGLWYYVTTAHGTPNGAMWKFSTANDARGARGARAFPGDGRGVAERAICVDRQFQSVRRDGDVVECRVVYTGQNMAEVKRIPTCVMPHGRVFRPTGSISIPRA